LLLTNSDFRVFLGDLTTVGRGVFRDTAFSLAEVSKEVGKKVEPSEDQEEAARNADQTPTERPSVDDFKHDAAEVSEVLAEGASKVAEDASASVSNRLSHGEKQTLMARLKSTVLNLRKKQDYTKSASTLAYLLSGVAEGLEENVHVSSDADRALDNLWAFVKSVGSPEKWNELEDAFKALVEDWRSDPGFEQHVDKMGDLLQSMLTDPEFYDDADKRLDEIRHEFGELKTDTNVKEDFDTFLKKLGQAIRSVPEDEEVRGISSASKKFFSLLFNDKSRGDLLSDSTGIFLPLLVQAVQYVPIPRLEISTPDVDLLLENLILEPGQTKNRSSFFPYQAKLSTQNDIEVYKGGMQTSSRLSSYIRVSLTGISVAAADVGYWLRCHSGLLRFGSEGIVSGHLDQRGMDITVDLEIGKDRIDELLSVRRVRVRIHHFDYTLKKSKFSWLAWLIKPLMRPILRKTLENQIAHGIKDSCDFVNRELLFARERLRATRIADPDSVWTFMKAVCARLVPRQDPNLYTRVGVDAPGKGVFEGVYAPGSVVKLWHEEGELAGERVQEFRQDGWRNTIFDI
jgi:hypothetical protein